MILALALHALPAQTVPGQEVQSRAFPRTLIWETVQIDAAFRSEGVAAGDVNRDGLLDVLAGELWYEAPSWTSHAIAPPGDYDPVTSYSECFIAGAGDVDGDGWIDFLRVGFPGAQAFWFSNPAGTAGFWDRHEITGSVGNESPSFVDVDGNGRLDLLMGNIGQERVVWLSQGPDPTQPWIEHAVGLPGQPGFDVFYHGLGFGDVDGDGRRDVLTPQGWYESPPSTFTSPWTFHPENLIGNGPTGPQMAAQMHAFDIDGDGLNDIVTSSPHSYGIWWWEQTASGFVEHAIADWFSQSHALEAADVDGDGMTDLVTGKRWYAHGPSGDPGSQEPVVLELFRQVRVGGTPRFKREEIDIGSGVGTQFVIIDLDADSQLDVVTSNKKGVFAHFQRRSP